jgi:alanyl-tRNA synthetase
LYAKQISPLKEQKIDKGRLLLYEVEPNISQYIGELAKILALSSQEPIIIIIGVKKENKFVVRSTSQDPTLHAGNIASFLGTFTGGKGGGKSQISGFGYAKDLSLLPSAFDKLITKYAGEMQNT